MSYFAVFALALFLFCVPGILMHIDEKKRRQAAEAARMQRERREREAEAARRAAEAAKLAQAAAEKKAKEEARKQRAQDAEARRKEKAAAQEAAHARRMERARELAEMKERELQAARELQAIKTAERLQQEQPAEAQKDAQERRPDVSKPVTLSAFAAQHAAAPGPFAGQVVAFTGTLYGDDGKQFVRKKAVALVRSLGGVACEKDMPAGTTLLVVGERPGADKLDKADERISQVTKITPKRFFEMTCGAA